MAPRYTCNFCGNVALYGGTLNDADELGKRTSINVCEEHRDEETQNLVIAFFGGR